MKLIYSPIFFFFSSLSFFSFDNSMDVHVMNKLRCIKSRLTRNRKKINKFRWYAAVQRCWRFRCADFPFSWHKQLWFNLSAFLIRLTWKHVTLSFLLLLFSVQCVNSPLYKVESKRIKWSEAKTKNTKRINEKRFVKIRHAV